MEYKYYTTKHIEELEKDYKSDDYQLVDLLWSLNLDIARLAKLEFSFYDRNEVKNVKNIRTIKNRINKKIKETEEKMKPLFHPQLIETIRVNALYYNIKPNRLT
jgi:hypothetical protein